jgi:hypothetical protein
MAGSIRAFLGFLLVFGAVGGLDNNSPLVACVAIAAAGLALMASGVAAMNSRNS